MSQLKAYITPEAYEEIKALPGNARQRVKKIIRDLSKQPRPAQCKLLQYPIENRQLYRIRMDNWRIVYAITESENALDILAVRRRPPYDYGDLTSLIGELE